jgi:hypothetical protein
MALPRVDPAHSARLVWPGFVERARLVFAGLPPMVARFLDDAIAARTDVVVVARVPGPEDVFAAVELPRTDIVLMSAESAPAPALIDRLLAVGVDAAMLLSASGDRVVIHERRGSTRELVARSAPQLLDEAVGIVRAAHLHRQV